MTAAALVRGKRVGEWRAEDARKEHAEAPTDMQWEEHTGTHKARAKIHSWEKVHKEMHTAQLVNDTDTCRG